MSKELKFHNYGEYVEVEVVVDNRMLISSASVALGREADLALCLSALVQIGVLDIEKLKAALVLAEPVAREKIAEIKKQGDQE